MGGEMVRGQAVQPNTTSSMSRGAISTTELPLMCPQCRHAACYSQGVADGVVLPCVFCEDGLPCIAQKRAVSLPPAPPQRVSLKKVPEGMLKARLEKANGGPLREPVASSQLSVEKTEEAKVLGKRICANTECGADFSPLRKDSSCCSKKCGQRVAYLKAHGGAPKRNLSRAEKASPAKSNGGGRRSALPREIPDTPAAGVATICVQEIHLDAFWQKLPLEDKANIFSTWLAGLLPATGN
jgi:hypothetical protein